MASFVSDGSREDFLGGGTNVCAVVVEPIHRGLISMVEDILYAPAHLACHGA